MRFIQLIASLVKLVLILAVAPALQAQPTQLYWGDTHLHTSSSTDAYENGKVNADIDTAYRFARGLPVINPASGTRVQIDRPLDFLVVADHAEMMGLQKRIARGDSAILDTAAGQRLEPLFEENVRPARCHQHPGRQSGHPGRPAPAGGHSWCLV